MKTKNESIFSQLFKPLYWPNGRRVYLVMGDRVSRALMGLGSALSMIWLIYGFIASDLPFVVVMIASLPVTAFFGGLAKWRMCVVVGRAEEAEKRGEDFTEKMPPPSRLEKYTKELEVAAAKLFLQAQACEDEGNLRKAARLRRRAANYEATSKTSRGF